MLSSNSSLSYSNLVNYDYRKALGHLFIKSKTVSDQRGDNYDFLEGVTIDGNPKKIEECPENESNIWCATYPTVSNIKLLNNLSINVNPDSQGKFNVIRPGFYFVTFNTNVNEEQTPISKLTPYLV